MQADAALLGLHFIALYFLGKEFPTPSLPVLEILTDTWPVGATLGLVATILLSGLGYPLRTCAAASSLCIIGIWLLVYSVYRVVHYYTSHIWPR